MVENQHDDFSIASELVDLGLKKTNKHTTTGGTILFQDLIFINSREIIRKGDDGRDGNMGPPGSRPRFIFPKKVWSSKKLGWT